MPDSYNSSAVDLSRLSAPDVVEQLSYEAIFAAKIAAMQVLMPTFDATVESDPVVKLLQLFAYQEMVLRQNFNDRARSVMLAYATGNDLDHLAALFGVTRMVLVAANSTTGAAAVMEGDEALRSRVVLAPESFSVAGPELAYVFHARSAHGEVLDATATSPSPGEVVVAVLARSGNGVASSEIVAAVAARVNSDGIRPLTDHVTVQSAAVVDYAVTASLYLFTGPDTATVMATARANLDAYVANSRKLGRDITRSALFAALHVEGVQRVVLTAPSADLVITATQAAHCTAITLEVAGNAY